MKWTKTETIEFDIDALPDDVYAVLVPHVCLGIEPMLLADGRIGMLHDFGSDDQYGRSWALEDLVKDAIELRREPDQLKQAICEFEKAVNLLRGALAHNAGSEPICAAFGAGRLD